METGYTQREPDYSSRPDSKFIETVSYIIQRWGGSKIWHRHIHDIYENQNTGIGAFEFAESILRRYRKK